MLLFIHLFMSLTPFLLSDQFLFGFKKAFVSVKRNKTNEKEIILLSVVIGFFFHLFSFNSFKKICFYITFSVFLCRSYVVSVAVLFRFFFFFHIQFWLHKQKWWSKLFFFSVFFRLNSQFLLRNGCVFVSVCYRWFFVSTHFLHFYFPFCSLFSLHHLYNRMLWNHL